jgi:hypothetical protein
MKGKILYPCVSKVILRHAQRLLMFMNYLRYVRLAKFIGSTDDARSYLHFTLMRPYGLDIFVAANHWWVPDEKGD